MWGLEALWNRQPAWLKQLIVLVGLVVVALLDHRSSATLPVSHLYYLPILLAALSFGYVGGVLSAGAAIGLYHLTHFVASGTAESLDEADLLRLALFIVVGLVAARLADQHRRIARLAGEVAARNLELTEANARLARLSQARADFVAIASHELRTPVAVMLAGADTLARLIASWPPMDQARLVRLADQVRNSARRLTRTVDNLLDATSIESGRLSIHHDEVRLADLLADCRSAFVGAALERLVLAEAPSELAVTGDRDKLARVLTNLIGNALKYSPESCPITTAVACSLDSVLVSVSDRGRGISEADIPRVFERYYRTESGREVASGSGLGLSISREIVRAHRGEITVRSVPGAGSTFTVTLPRRAEGDEGVKRPCRPCVPRSA